MKTIPFLTILFLSSALVLSACTPRDVEVADKEVMGKIRYPRGTKGNDGQAKPAEKQFSIGTFAWASFLSEKHLEVAQMVKAAMNVNEKTSDGFIKEVLNDDAEGLTFSLVPVLKNLNYQTESPWKQKLTKKIIFTYTENESGLNLLKGSNEAGQALLSSADRTDVKRHYVNLREENVSFDIQGLDSDVLEVTFKEDLKITVAKGGPNTNIVGSLEIMLKIDKGSLDREEAVILSAKGVVKYPGPSQRQYSVESSTQNLVAVLGSECNYLKGDLNAQAGPNNKFTVAMSEDEIEIQGRGWKSALASCQERPVVDLGRLHIY